MSREHFRELERTVWDVIVVGTGMGGGTLGFALARAGKRVLFLEKGMANFLSSPGVLRQRHVEVVHDIGLMAEAVRREALARGGRAFDELRDESSGRPRDFLPYIGAGTGGSSALYGMACERLFERDFAPRANFPDPGDSTVPESWPIDYATLRPWYQRAEALYRVHGGPDPLRPADHDARLLESPPFTAGNQELADFFTNQGLHPYPLHLACELLPECRNCQGFLCPAPCKNDSTRVCVTPAIDEHGASLLAECRVRRLEADETQVREVICDHRDQTLRFQARQVVLAAGALATPVILLESRSPAWPDGLANQSGMVGRNLMRHCIDLVLVRPKTKEPALGQTKELALNDFYVDDGVKLGTLQSFGPLPPYECLVRPLATWGSRFARLFRHPARWFWSGFLGSALPLAAIMEDLPYRDNRVLPPTEDPAAAHRRIRLHYTLHASERARLERFRARLGDVLRPYRPATLRGAEDNKGIAHVCGTCRFGLDPGDSVLDPTNRAHGLDNLYVVDASFFPSSGGINPSLTIAANALRVAAHLLDRLG